MSGTSATVVARNSKRSDAEVRLKEPRGSLEGLPATVIEIDADNFEVWYGLKGRTVRGKD